MDGDYMHLHGSTIHTVSCANVDGVDLLAVGGSHSVEVLSCGELKSTLLATFYIGMPVSAVAWSPRARCCSLSSYSLELVALGVDGIVRYLCATSNNGTEERVINLNSPSTIRGSKIQDVVFCGDAALEHRARYIATVADDGVLAVCDMYPEGTYNDQEHPLVAHKPISTLLAIWHTQLPYALYTLTYHANTGRLLVSSNQGSLLLVDWISAFQQSEDSSNASREAVTAEFVDPIAFSASALGTSLPWPPSASWKIHDANTIGAVIGEKWSIWEQSHGQRPYASGDSFPGGCRRFRWCPTDSHLFAVAPLDTAQGAVLHVHDTNFLKVPPATLTIKQAPHVISDYDWLGTRMQRSPRIAVAVGVAVIIGSIGEASEEI